MSELEIFAAALEKLEPAQRAAYLDQACAGNAALRERLETLLRTHASAGDFLARSAAVEASCTPTEREEDAQVKAQQGSMSGAGGEPGIERDEVVSFFQPSSKPGSLGRLSHYEVLEIIGQGGFGTVVKAFDEKLQRMVAIKIMSPQLAATSPARKRFLREARSSAAIHQENVVAIHAIEEQPLPYLVMEHVAGQTLQQRLDNLGPFDTAETLRIGVQIANGLAAAHALGKVHRDIKPANILLENSTNRVKLTDFGLARATDDASLTGSGIIAGTPMYMAPEQAQGVNIDHRADLFSLGSVLYVMCSGRPPFRAATTLAVLKRVAEDTPRPIHEIIPEVPQWLCDIIAKLHAKKPEDRFGSAREVADVLARCLAELQLHGKVNSAVETPRKTGGASPTVEPVENANPTPDVVATPATRRATALKAVLRSSPPPVRPRRRRLVLALAIFATLLVGFSLTEATGVTKILHGTVIRLFSSEGTLVVDVDDPDVSVSIDGEEVIIRGAGTTEIRVKPGQHKVQASKDGKVVQQELVTVSKNGRQIVRISREVAPEALPVAGADERQIAEWVLSLGGTVVVDDGSGLPSLERMFKSPGELPPGRFKLQHVELQGNKHLDNAALKTFTGLSDLRMLKLDKTRVTDAGLKELAGLKRLVQLELSYTNVTDAGLKELARLKSLTILNLNYTHVSDAGLKELVGLTNLKDLFLYRTQVTDAGLKELARLKKLKALYLANTRVTDAGLKELAGLNALQRLELAGTQITDAGLKELIPLDGLRQLLLHATGVTDAGLKELAGFTKLERLTLGGTKVTDAGLKELTRFESLASLTLNNTKVSNAGLLHLHQLRKLTTLDLTKTKVTAQGIATLQKALPGCQIVSDLTPAAGKVDE